MVLVSVGIPVFVVVVVVVVVIVVVAAAVVVVIDFNPAVVIHGGKCRHLDRV